jgi:hypothetical protein
MATGNPRCPGAALRGTGTTGCSRRSGAALHGTAIIGSTRRPDAALHGATTIGDPRCPSAALRGTGTTGMLRRPDAALHGVVFADTRPTSTLLLVAGVLTTVTARSPWTAVRLRLLGTRGLRLLLPWLRLVLGHVHYCALPA